jgi:hypothetical protein
MESYGYMAWAASAGVDAALTDTAALRGWPTTCVGLRGWRAQAAGRLLPQYHRIDQRSLDEAWFHRKDLPPPEYVAYASTD